jgi:hypothetical protein
MPSQITSEIWTMAKDQEEGPRNPIFEIGSKAKNRPGTTSPQSAERLVDETRGRTLRQWLRPDRDIT